MLLASAVLFTAAALPARGQAVSAGKRYEDMSRAERLVFVGERARQIAREISGNDYQFTADFERDIQKSVTYYAERIGKTGKTDLRVVVERAHAQAPTVNAVFRARNVSPLVGLYLAFIESEYNNLGPSGPSGAVGMFQFLPATGQKYGLSLEDLSDVAKSADAAARYITDSVTVFEGDPMKEALALLSYNRGAQRVSRELKLLVNEQNKQCSICALTADRSKRDETFGAESVYYVPRFFAAAIIGENPQVFGLQGQALSSH
jgi:membrane-bound lytic murein transglycosylase D